jgi:hypothetical protein
MLSLVKKTKHKFTFTKQNVLPLLDDYIIVTISFDF